MTVIMYTGISVKDFVPLSRKINTDPYQHILNGLKEDIKFDVWEIPSYTSFGGNVEWCYSNLRVSIKGMIAYDLGKKLRISTGTLRKGNPSVHIPTLGYSEYFPLDRIIACTYLPIPDELKEFGKSKLRVGRINGQLHQVHLANLKWVK